MSKTLALLVASLFAVAAVGVHAASHSGGTPAKKDGKAEPAKAAASAPAKKADAPKK